MQTHTPFVGVDAHIDPCSRHNRFYETLRQKRVYPTGGQGRPPLRVRSCSHRCTKICNVVPRGRGRTPPLRQIITCSLFTITYSLNSPRPYITTNHDTPHKKGRDSRLSPNLQSKNSIGSTDTPFLVTAKCRCGSWAISSMALAPTAPIVCPALTRCPTVTVGIAARF